MRVRKQFRRAATLLLIFTLLTLPANLGAAPTMRAQAPNIGVNGFFSADRAQQGRVIQAAVVVDIPSGYHINSNRPLAKFLVPTSLKIETPKGFRLGAVSYPRAVVRKFEFSEDSLSVYEGRVVLRFSVTVPANSATGVTALRARLKYQSCSNEVCFPPTSREIAMPIAVVTTSEPVKRINGGIFGGRRQ